MAASTISLIRFTLLGVLMLFKIALTAQNMVDPFTPSDALPQFSGAGIAWQLAFSDEFNADALDTGKWQILESSSSRTPRPGLGIDYWFWVKQNVWLENGNLVLRVSKYNENTMYCGSVNSNNKYETTYGYFETRIQIADATKGAHTAFWFQGDNMQNVDGTANDGAEIDVFESAWLEDYTKSVIHIDGYGADKQANTKKYDTPGIHQGYHTWGFYWTPEYMKIYYDEELKVTYSAPEWIVHADEYIWLSDGASFGYTGDQFLNEPIGPLTEALIDYIRVWKAEGTGTVLFPDIPSLGVYPNPSDGIFRINTNTPMVSCHVFDMRGIQVEEIDGEAGTQTLINLENLPGGLYLLRVKLENGLFAEERIILIE